MADNSKRTLIQKMADIIRGWQLKYDNETVKKMLAHPVWKSTEKMIVAKPRENGRGDWVM
jgi:hypothetical protein